MFCYNTRMVLYHASNCEVKMPMLVASNRLLDFGPGFYTPMNPAKFATYLAVVISPTVVGLLAERLSLGEVEAMEKFSRRQSTRHYLTRERRFGITARN